MKYLIAIIGAMALFSCSKKDKEIPVLSLQTPSDSAVVKAGETVLFSASITDNDALSQFKIDIHNNFDGHNHQKVNITPWEKIIINDLSGTSASPELSIPVPENAAAGWYHMVVTAVDASGNLSEFSLRNLKIVNPADTINPNLNISTPSEGAQFALNSSMTISGSASDNTGLKSLKITINPTGSNNTLFNQTIELTDLSANWSVDVSFTGISWGQGAYRIKLVLLDQYYNSTVSTINFTIN
jgi:uncharacterized membrane protein